MTDELEPKLRDFEAKLQKCVPNDVLSRSDWRSRYRSPADVFRFVFSSLTVTVIGGMLLLSVSYYCYGGVVPGIERLRGHSILLESPEVNVNSVDNDLKVASFSVKIRNLTSKPIKVVGYEVGCSCVGFERVPMTLPAYKATELMGKLHWEGDPQNSFEYAVVVYFDSGVSPVRFTVGADGLK